MEEPRVHASAPNGTCSSAAANLTRWQRAGLAFLVAGFIIFGVLVEVRSSFLRRRMTDLGVYLRVAWAVRTGADLYSVTDDNGWHYQYPPLFAILMAPLADPPAGVERAGMLPFGLSVAIWYVFSLACLFLGVHWLASALEERARHGSRIRENTGSGKPAFSRMRLPCRRWWALRVLPILACLPPIGHTLMRGQVNLLLLALLCATAAALVRRQGRRAGWWLAAAICLKVIPAFLLLIPVWRRDGRCLVHCGLGLIIGLALIPAAVFGVAQTGRYYQIYVQELLAPGMGQGSSQTRAKELINMTGNDSQSLLAAMHNTWHLDRATRPHQPGPTLRWTSIALGILLTCLPLLAYGSRPRSGPATALLLGTLTINMLLLSPVSHLHYFSLSVPVVMGLLAARWEQTGNDTLGAGMLLLLGLNLVANTLPNLQGLEMLRDVGVAMYGALLLWLAGCAVLLKKDKQADVAAQGPAETEAIAA
jgi:hypothetical protein